MKSLTKGFSITKVGSLVSAAVLVPSLSHHLWNFWGLPWEQMILLIAGGVPLLAYILIKFTDRISSQWERIPVHRWILFITPAVIIAAIIGWRTFSAPIVWHELEIFPPRITTGGEIQLVEIKVAHGRKVDFSKIPELGDWTIQDSLLVSDGSYAAPLVYLFQSPIDKPVSLTFTSSTKSAEVVTTLDGVPKINRMNGSQAGFELVTLHPRYRFGINARLMAILVFVIDVLAWVSIFSILWLMQEVTQRSEADSSHREKKTIFPQQAGLITLLVIGFILHTINYLSVPLLVVGDSTSYLSGAVHWIQVGNLDGVSTTRGPGTTFLFAPILLIFGRNPWGMKFFLHLLAYADIPLAYRLGWQVSHRRWFAFCAGLIAALTPDLYLFSNGIMSDGPNIFLGLAFSTLLLSALETFSWVWLISTMLVGAFAVLLRSENILMLGLSIFFILLKSAIVKPAAVVWKLGIVVLIAFTPLLAWSAHNYRLHGFFGLSDYFGEVLYDGWIYFGESSHIPITAPDSEAARTISRIYTHNPKSADDTDAPTGWEILPALTGAGYTKPEAFSILLQTAIDSIRKSPDLALELLFIKLREGFAPETQGTFTFPLEGEPSTPDPLKLNYFDEEQFSLPVFIRLQRAIYDLYFYWFHYFYQIWVWLCLAALFLVMYRRPLFVWVPLAWITAGRILFPTILGLSHWRYILSGIIPLQIFGLASLYSIAFFLLPPVQISKENRKISEN